MNAFECHIRKVQNLLLTLVFLFLVHPAAARAQEGISLIDSLLAEEKFASADSALQSQIAALKASADIDSLVSYGYYVGRIAQLTEDIERAADELDQFVSEILLLTDDAGTIRRAYMEQASFLGTIGRPADAYQSNEQALAYTQKMDDKTGEDLGEIEIQLGVMARRMGDIALAIQHNRNALQHFESDTDTQKMNYYQAYNAMGAGMWFSSKTDSALYFYDKALETLAAMDPVPVNSYYRPALVNNNKAALHSMSGHPTEALETMKAAVDGFRNFIASGDADEARRTDAREALFQAIENLGGVYKDLGYYTKARDLLEYAHEQKTIHLDPESPEMFKANILLGQIELSLKNFDLALQYLNKGIDHIERLPEEYSYWHADAYYYKALLLDELGEQSQAAPYFEQSDKLYKRAYGNFFDEFYLNFLANSALFYAENGQEEKAIKQAAEALGYVTEHDGEYTLQAFKHRQNLASVYYESGRYSEALKQVDLSLTMLEGHSFQRKNLLDSLQVEFHKPQAILLKAKAEYHLEAERDTLFLKGLLGQMDEAIGILDRRRRVLPTERDVGIQIANNRELFEFSKKISLDLYRKTGNKQYLDRTLGYHESGIYNRIRSRINSTGVLEVANIPPDVRAREKQLRERLGQTLEEDNISEYLSTHEDWQSFLKMLQDDYNSYFSLRYGGFHSDLDAAAPDSATIIRYLFIEDVLYAAVINQAEKVFFELDYATADSSVYKLHQHPFDTRQTGIILHDLYSTLWQPLEAFITTTRVIIIPDGELFNLSFESLTRDAISDISELAEKSLLANHAFSYNYSLTLLEEGQPLKLDQNFIAFAPGFDEEIKQKYKNAVRDSLYMDRAYLNLLPQPFTVDLVKSLYRTFGGTAFIGEESTEDRFLSEASGHKVIHIGTHAESNNVRPELSRLFFSKSTADPLSDDDHSVYAYEIYNYDLTSNLTLLTACATGKPQYQPGEGMISLAHAFNYAGSKSLLTALWDIDEKASSEIVESFYQYLTEGLSKDVALQRAKLTYLSSARGRTASPQYWAGLVLMGDIGTIPLQKRSAFGWWFALLLIVFVLVGTWAYQHQRKRLPG